jgi:hypothetical protein
VPAFETPAWGADGALSMRHESAPGGALLLRHSAAGAVYRYAPAERTLAPASEEEWRRGGPLVSCEEQLPPRPSVLRIDPKSDRLLAADGREVRTAGRVVLAMRSSPSGKWVAVLSADGPKRVSAFPSIAGGGASGQHYHQLLSLPDAAPRGEPVRLNIGAADQVLTPCWSPGESFVAYTDLLFFKLSLVETKTPANQTHAEVSK